MDSSGDIPRIDDEIDRRSPISMDCALSGAATVRSATTRIGKRPALICPSPHGASVAHILDPHGACVALLLTLVAEADRRERIMVPMLIAAIAGATATAGWWMAQIRGRRKNELGACGICGDAWTGKASSPFLLHGRLVCGHCAGRARRRVGLQFALLATASAIASGLIVVTSGLVLFVAFPVVSTALMTLGAVRAMKSANRAAQWRILVGDYPPCRLLD